MASLLCGTADATPEGLNPELLEHTEKLLDMVKSKEVLDPVQLKEYFVDLCIECNPERPDKEEDPTEVKKFKLLVEFFNVLRREDLRDLYMSDGSSAFTYGACSWCEHITFHPLRDANVVRRSTYSCSNCSQTILLCRTITCGGLSKGGVLWDDEMCSKCNETLKCWPDSATWNQPRLDGGWTVAEVLDEILRREAAARHEVHVALETRDHEAVTKAVQSLERFGFESEELKRAREKLGTLAEDKSREVAVKQLYEAVARGDPDIIAAAIEVGRVHDLSKDGLEEAIAVAERALAGNAMHVLSHSNASSPPVSPRQTGNRRSLLGGDSQRSRSRSGSSPIFQSLSRRFSRRSKSKELATDGSTPGTQSPTSSEGDRSRTSSVDVVPDPMSVPDGLAPHMTQSAHGLPPQGSSPLQDHSNNTHTHASLTPARMRTGAAALYVNGVSGAPASRSPSGPNQGSMVSSHSDNVNGETVVGGAKGVAAVSVARGVLDAAIATKDVRHIEAAMAMYRTTCESGDDPALLEAERTIESILQQKQMDSDI
eukprot:Rmarinus@m.14055